MSLMFDGSAEEAINQYVSLFEGSKIFRLEHYGANEDGREGLVKQAEFEEFCSKNCPCQSLT